jgi:microcystin-dependent protein
MAQPYVGEVRMFAGNFAPAGWLFCEGQLVAISENETLFNLIGTTYGGDGQSTFAMPDLRGRLLCVGAFRSTRATVWSSPRPVAWKKSR